MAEEPKKVVVQANRVDLSILPPGFPLPYKLLVIQQGDDLQRVASASNGAGELAYQAAVKNEEQDITLANHEQRIGTLRIDVDGHEIRISAVEGGISNLTLQVSTIEGSLTTIQTSLSAIDSRVGTIENNYVSKSVTGLQTLSSPISVATSVAVNGTKVLGARDTGWNQPTFVTTKGTFNAETNYSVSTSYNQGEIQLIGAGLKEARRRLATLEAAIRGHGLID